MLCSYCEVHISVDVSVALTVSDLAVDASNHGSYTGLGVVRLIACLTQRG